MLTGAYRDLLPAIAGCAATLTGLLFVAMTVAGPPIGSPGRHPAGPRGCLHPGIL